jgi:hypothetical protein
VHVAEVIYYVAASVDGYIATIFDRPAPPFSTAVNNRA